MNCKQDSAVPIGDASSVGQTALGKNCQKGKNQEKSQFPKIARVKRFWQLGLLGSITSVLAALPAMAAQQVSISYGPLEISVPVQALETYAQTGEVDRSLRFYTQFIPSENREQFRQVLRDRVQLNVNEISQVTYSSVGETSLQHLGQVVQTESRQNGFYALRSAAISAAADPEGLTLLNLVKHFPSQTIRIRADRAMEVAEAFSQLSRQTDRMTAFLSQQNAADAAAQPLDFDRRTDLQQVGSVNWQKQTLTLKDESRDRQIAVDLYLPQLNVQTPAPLMIISHGIAADRGDFSELAQHLVSYGFAVAVLDHPGSDTQQLRNWLGGLTDEMTAADEFIHRPKDVSFLIDRLEELNRSSSIKDRLKLDQIGVIGHSMGGYTALALAGANLNLNLLKQQCQPDLINLNSINFSMLLQCEALHTTQPDTLQLKDDRVKAVIAVNSASNSIFGQSGLQDIKIPVMMIGGSDDLISPVLLEQVCPFTWLTMPDKYLAVIKKGTHVYSSQSSRGLFPGAAENPNPGQAQRYLEALSLAFSKVYVADQPDYRDYLKASYAKSISRSPLDLTVTNGANTRSIEQTLGGTCLGGS